MITLVCIAKHNAEGFRSMIDSAQQHIEAAIVVLDSEAADGIEGYKPEFVKYMRRELNKDFAAQRNFACDHVDCGWILHLDTDENLCDELWSCIRTITDNSDADAILLPRRNIVELADGTFRDWSSWPDWQPKLHRAGVRWIHPVHELLDTKGRRVTPLEPDKQLYMTHRKTAQEQHRSNVFYATIPFHKVIAAEAQARIKNG